jgi:diadenosine tetraphosphatase ApaH/serine/threonine PP2A family protein phosphatase
MINSVFDYFPLAAVLQEKYFCVHGGLCEQLITLQQIEEISLPYELKEGSHCLGNHILWSDPDVQNQVKSFALNPRRGQIFGPEAVDDFFSMNSGLQKIIRAHQTANEGFWTALDDRVVTVFSAPDYRGVCKNWAGIMVIRKNEQNCILQFEKCPHSGVVEPISMNLL